MRTYFGRPSSSMRLRTWTATFTSVVRRSSVRERNLSPIPRLNRLIAGGTVVVPRRLLPGHAASLGDKLEVVVPLRGLARGRPARHRGGARWHDHSRRGMALADAGVHAFLVVRTIACDRGDSS